MVDCVFEETIWPSVWGPVCVVGMVVGAMRHQVATVLRGWCFNAQPVG